MSRRHTYENRRRLGDIGKDIEGGQNAHLVFTLVKRLWNVFPGLIPALTFGAGGVRQLTLMGVSRSDIPQPHLQLHYITFVGLGSSVG